MTENQTIPPEYEWLLNEPLDRVIGLLEPDQADIIELIDLIGLENVLQVMARYGGQNFYIPKFPGPFRPHRDQRIKAECNGFNQRELGVRYNLATSSIYSILRDGDQYQQDSLFGEI